MSEQAIEIRTPDGTADGFVYRPDNGKAGPGVIHLPDIGGIRPANRGMAKRLSDQGYTVLLVNVFYRAGRTPLWSFPMVFGEDKTMKRLAELASPLTPEAIERDAVALSDFLTTELRAHGEPAQKLAAIGYCFTGGIALRMAAARPEQIAAVASFHGGGLYTESAQSPHLALPRVAARLYFGHAENDRMMTAEAIAKLDAALKSWGKNRFESEVYEGAAHGWTVPGGGVYNEPQAERAFSKLTQLLAESLK